MLSVDQNHDGESAAIVSSRSIVSEVAQGSRSEGIGSTWVSTARPSSSCELELEEREPEQAGGPQTALAERARQLSTDAIARDENRRVAVSSPVARLCRVAIDRHRCDARHGRSAERRAWRPEVRRRLPGAPSAATAASVSATDARERRARLACRGRRANWPRAPASRRLHSRDPWRRRDGNAGPEDIGFD